MHSRVRRLTASLVAATAVGAMPAAVGVLAPAAQVPDQQLRLDPDTVYDGEATTISGDNCPEGGTEIEHLVQGEISSEATGTIATFTVDTTDGVTNPTAPFDGNSWEVTVTVPEGTPAGDYDVTASCGRIAVQPQPAGFIAPAQQAPVPYVPATLTVLNQPVPEEPEPEAPAEEQPAAEEPAEADAVVAEPTYTG